ncbi:hypothetical protein [Ralstonia wenshanensis]|uniref:Uncharacterized protein n=1 Tax=Ralstonia wenshanensis TaxID=2842456 RepID=A0AAD2EUE8_9RALS|nr:hypothetical protein [Ralstonia wenshanensis]CAJ0702477.1 hypothetical protein LMG18091_03695 [Ralstonia wenshanensis]
MAAVLGWGGGALRGCVDRWLRGGFALSLVFVLVAGAVDAHAAVGYGGCSAPGQMCIQGNSVGVEVSVRQSGNGVPQTPSAGVMSVLVPITIGVAAVGAAAVAIPATGAIAIAGDAIAAAGLAAIRSRVIQGAALMTLIGTIPSSNGLSIDASGNVVAPPLSSNASDTGFNAHKWCYAGGTGGSACGDSPVAACIAVLALTTGFKPVFTGVSANGSLYSCNYTYNNTAYNGNSSVSSTSSCVTNYVVSSGSCVPDPNGAKQPATDSQLTSAFKAAPASWPSIYNGMNCGPTLALTDGSTSDPCYGLYSDSRTGFGVTFSTGGSSWSNNGCAVNSTSCPSATVTTAPTTDSSTKSNADGSKTTTTNTTTKTTTVTGTNDRTNPVEGQTTTTTQTSTTVTNPDGSTTTTTTTTTDQAPPATAGNANQQQKDQTQPTTATFQSPELKLYTPKDKTFAQVFQGFVSRVQSMPWYSSITGFFNVTIGGGSCPHWAVPASRWNGPLDLTPYLCGGSMPGLFAMAGAIVLAVAAWAAVKIAFL